MGDVVYLGSYFAHWQKIADKRVVAFDNYDTRGCTGKGCVH